MYWCERWLGFPDLWSGQKPWWNWYLTLVVNFGEVRRAQLAKSRVLTSIMLGLLGSFKVCSDAKERMWCGKQREANAPIQSLLKLQPWFLSLRWKSCLLAEMRPWCLSLQRKTCPWTEHIYIYYKDDNTIIMHDITWKNNEQGINYYLDKIIHFHSSIY